MSGAARKAPRHGYGVSRGGVVRFEVRGLGGDRELVRAVARRLVELGPEGESVRGEIMRALGEGDSSGPGGVLAALRRSPLVGADIDLSRRSEDGREIDL